MTTLKDLGEQFDAAFHTVAVDFQQIFEKLARIDARLTADERSVPIRERVLLSPAQAADYLGIGETTVRALRQAGEIEYVHVGSIRRYTRASLDAYVARQRDREQRSVLPARRSTRRAS